MIVSNFFQKNFITTWFALASPQKVFCYWFIGYIEKDFRFSWIKVDYNIRKNISYRVKRWNLDCLLEAFYQVNELYNASCSVVEFNVSIYCSYESKGGVTWSMLWLSFSLLEEYPQCRQFSSLVTISCYFLNKCDQEIFILDVTNWCC